jgi:hypothetical protein
MTDHFENDELLERLRAEDPAADDADAEAPDGREAIRSRVRELLESDSRESTRRLLQPRWAVAAAIVVIAVGVGLGLTLGGSSSGPPTALAIEKTPKWVTLRLTDPSASDAQMNQELADAGIDRVRVRSVPGDQKSVGTWAGYVELGPHCLGGVTRYGYDIDIPTVKHFNGRTKHGAEKLFDLTLPRHPGEGALTAQEVGTPGSKSIVRLPTDSIDNPRNAAKILVPVRPRNPDDTAAANDIGVDQLIALGGVFAQYGDAIQSGHTSCADFGLTPYSKAPFPPSDQGWVVLHVTTSRGGARKMTRELRSGGIEGEVRQIPAQRQEVGRYLGFVRVPPLRKHSPPFGNGNQADVVPNAHAHGPAKHDIALRRSAFDAFPNARWIFYVGRPTRPGEQAKVVGQHGPESARAALRGGCKGLAGEIAPLAPSNDAGRAHVLSRLKRCASIPRIQVPAP